MLWIIQKSLIKNEVMYSFGGEIKRIVITLVVNFAAVTTSPASVTIDHIQFLCTGRNPWLRQVPNIKSSSKCVQIDLHSTFDHFKELQMAFIKTISWSAHESKNNRTLNYREQLFFVYAKGVWC
jgi:hypothetical protein